MPIKKFNVKAGLSVGTTTITDVIDNGGNATFNSTTANTLTINNDATISGNLTIGGDVLFSNVSFDTANTANYATTSESANTASTVTGNVQANITSVGTLTELTVSGTATLSNITTTNYVKTTPKTVSTLESASTVGAGSRSFVSDATSTVFGDTAVGGGSNFVPVWSNGTNWLVG